MEEQRDAGEEREQGARVAARARERNLLLAVRVARKLEAVVGLERDANEVGEARQRLLRPRGVHNPHGALREKRQVRKPFEVARVLARGDDTERLRTNDATRSE